MTAALIAGLIFLLLLYALRSKRDVRASVKIYGTAFSLEATDGVTDEKNLEPKERPLPSSGS